MTFRKDINGLRAIAVLSVVIFHFEANWLPGGFSGVDIFFVISGFLMTKIILSGLIDKNFSILKFYLARARRILPALLVLSIILLVYGWLFLTSVDFEELGKHVASSIVFLSNFVYWQEVGYFDVASHQKWLLHTWSLSVEWQFYILYPLLLVVVSRFISINSIKVMILAFTVLGFIYSCWVSYNWPSSSYYLLPSRAWEMLFGAIAFLYPLKMQDEKKKILEIIGLLLIISSFVFISNEDFWPGYLAILPVMGAFFVIQASKSNFLTGSVIFQKIGLYSYSIYLWHWPLVVANSKYDLGLNVLVYLFLSITLGFISYKFIESIGITLRGVSILLLVSLFSSVLIVYSDGASFRVPEEFRLDKKTYHEKYYGGSGYGANKIIYINETEGSFDLIVAGDSFGHQYAKALDYSDFKVQGIFDHGCLISPSYSRYVRGREDIVCSSEYEKLSATLAESDAPLLLASSWDTYQYNLIKKGGKKPLSLTKNQYHKILFSELDSIIKNNNPNGRRHFYILGVPFKSKSNAFECLAATRLLGHRYLQACDSFQDQKGININEELKVFANSREAVSFIDPNEFLCSKARCMTIDAERPIHSDQSHLSVFGAEIVIEGISDIIIK